MGYKRQSEVFNWDKTHLKYGTMQYNFQQPKYCSRRHFQDINQITQDECRGFSVLLQMNQVSTPCTQIRHNFLNPYAKAFPSGATPVLLIANWLPGCYEFCLPTAKITANKSRRDVESVLGSRCDICGWVAVKRQTCLEDIHLKSVSRNEKKNNNC